MGAADECLIRSPSRGVRRVASDPDGPRAPRSPAGSAGQTPSAPHKHPGNSPGCVKAIDRPTSLVCASHDGVRLTVSADL